jgi:hypothetical protein
MANLKQTNRKQTTMKQTMTTYQVADALVRDEYANWSIAGASALAKHFEAIEDETGEELQFDAVEIRCAWSEYENLVDWAQDYCRCDRDGCGWRYHLNIKDDMDEDEVDDIIRERIRKNGKLIEFDGGIIVSSF